MARITLILTCFFAWLTPLVPFFFLTGFAIGVDTYFGTKLAKKNKEFKSRRFSRVIYKFGVYNLIILSGFSLDLYLLGDFVKIFSPVDLTVTKVIVLVVLINEGVSIDEKLVGLYKNGIFFYLRRAFLVAKGANKEYKDTFKD